MDQPQQQPSTVSERLFAAVADRDVDVVSLSYLLKEATAADVNYQDKKGHTVLRKASLFSVDVLNMLLGHAGIDVNFKSRKDGRTALITASAANRPEAVNALLAHPTIDVNLADKEGRTALIVASSAGRNAVVEALVGHPSIDLNSQDKDGNTALMCASNKSYSSVVHALLEQPGIDVNAQNKYGGTALMMAFSEEIVEMILAHSEVLVNLTNKVPSIGSERVPNVQVSPQKLPALVEQEWRLPVPVSAPEQVAKAFSSVMVLPTDAQKDARGKKTSPSPATTKYHHQPVLLTLMDQPQQQPSTVSERLFAAVADKDVDLKALSSLLKRATAADVNYQDKNGYTVLRRALRCLPDVFEMVLAHPEINVNLQSRKDGRTVLINAADANLPASVDALLAHPAIDVNVVDKEGRTALIAASALCRKHIVKALLAHGVKDLNWQDKDGNTALMFCASHKSYSSIVHALLEQPGIDVNAQNKNGDTALMMAPSRKIVEMILAHSEVLVNLANKDGNTALIQAPARGHTEKVEILLNCVDIEVNFQNKDGNTALIVACRQGWSDMVQMLLAYDGIDVSIRNQRHDTALSCAVSNGHTEIVKMLQAFDNASGNAALVSAAQWGRLEELQQLLANSFINVNAPAKQSSGKTALILAAQWGRLEVVNALLAHPDINVNTVAQHTGETALLLAAQWGHIKVVQTLLAIPGIDADIAATESKKTALILAAQWGRLEVVKTLLAQPAININATTTSGETALILASNWGRLEVVQQLLAWPTHTKRSIKTAFVRAKKRGHTDIARMLQAHQNNGVRKFQEPCCLYCPEVSLIAIHNRHIICLQDGIDICGTHPQACTRACESNLVDYLEILRTYKSPWTEETTSAAASRGHVEALQFAMERNCPFDSDDIVRCAARCGSLPTLRYLVEQQGAYMHEDGSTFGAAFERAHLSCLMYLLDQMCPLKAYTFGGINMWPMYEAYLGDENEVGTYDARFKACIIAATHYGWVIDEHLTLYVYAHEEWLPECVAYLQTQ